MNPKTWIPVAALAVWLVIWRVKFSVMENVTGVVGLCLVMFAVAVFLLGSDWGSSRTRCSLHPWWQWGSAVAGGRRDSPLASPARR